MDGVRDHNNLIGEGETFECGAQTTGYSPEFRDLTQIGAFLWVYRGRAIKILSAMENGQWQRAWLLLKDRQRLCQPGAELPRLKGLRSDGTFEEGRLTDLSFLREIYKEVQDIDAKCVELLERQIGTTRMELRWLNTLRRWSLSQLLHSGHQARFVDAEG